MRAGLMDRLRRPEYLVALALGLFHAWLMARLDGGDFFNSYPFISDDGFDWIAQGLALNERLMGVNAEPWPVLRNPVFVLVTALDDALKAGGGVIILANGAAVTLAAAALGWLGRRLGYRAPALIAALLAYYFSTLGFWRLWVLADTVAQGLMTASFCLLIAHLLTPSSRRLALGAGFAVAAGLTQTYGVIPFCGVAATVVALRLLQRQPVGAALPASIVAVLALTWAGQKVWAALIPHGMVPTQFGLLQPSLEMAPYYANVWAVTFGVFAPLAIAALLARWRRRFPPTHWEVGLLAVVAVFSALAFFYQWRESRFTFIYLSVAFAALLALARPAPDGSRPAENKLVWTCAVAVFVGMVVAPLDYWSPKLLGTRIDWNRAWVGEALLTPPVDRFSLRQRCPSVEHLCPAAVAPPQASPYRQAMFDQYKRRTENDPH